MPLSFIFLAVDNYDQLKQKAIRLGADLFGVTETLKLVDYIDAEIKETALTLPFTVSIAVRVQRKVFESLKDGPNLIYKHHYRIANMKLDQITFAMGQYIQSSGFEAMPINASVITDWQNQRSHLSHRHAAMYAGLGFLGRSGLLVHPEYGAAVRLASLLTDMPLRVDKPMNLDCGECYECVAACPVEAISPEGITEFDGQACYNLLKQFEKRRGISVMICGLCIKACKGLKND
jgi:epoxyqueuosine reductase